MAVHTDVRARVAPPAQTATAVVALLPAYNEERFIGSVVLQAREYSDEVVVVDDGSTDRTAEIAEVAGATVVRLETNAGKASAVAAGFRYIQANCPGIVVCLDADAQHDPAEIPTMVEPIRRGDADVVIGSRFLGVHSDIPRWRRIGQFTLTTITNSLSGSFSSDSQSGFRAFGPEAVAVLDMKSRGLALESEMQFQFQDAGLRVTEVPIRVQYRDGLKRNAFVQGLQVIDAMLTLVARRRPLAFISLPGLVLAVAGFLLGLRVAIHVFETGQLLVGSSVLTALLILGGLMLGATGVLLHSMEKFMERAVEEIKRAVGGKGP